MVFSEGAANIRSAIADLISNIRRNVASANCRDHWRLTCRFQDILRFRSEQEIHKIDSTILVFRITWHGGRVSNRLTHISAGGKAYYAN